MRLIVNEEFYNSCRSPRQKPRILIVDDESSFHEDLVVELRNKFRLDFIESGLIACEQIFLFKEDFDLIILNPGKPEIGCTAFLKELRYINLAIPILVVTDCSTHEMAKLACNMRVVGYIEKPPEVRELLDKIDEAIYTKELKSPFVELSIIINNKDPQVCHPAIVKCIDEIHRRIHSVPSLDHLSQVSGVSKYYLCKLFRKVCGMTIRGYCARVRVEMVKKLLRETSYTVAEIQNFAGYRNRTHFYSTFKGLVGLSPLKYRQMFWQSESVRSKQAKESVANLG